MPGIRSVEAYHYRNLYNHPFWDALRTAKLVRNPDCERCKQLGRTTPATVVHHIREHKGDRRLFFKVANLQSLCAPCHDGPMKQAEYRGFENSIGADGFPLDPRHPANRLALG